jgi:signal peptidase II
MIEVPQDVSMSREVNQQHMTAARRLAVNATLFLTIALVGCVADLATKSWIFAKLGMPGTGDPIVLWPGVLSLTTSLNEGALFGFGQGKVTWFAVVSIVAAAGIGYWLLAAGGLSDRLLSVALGCIMAGILGNLYDRLGMPGMEWNYPPDRVGEAVHAVRDWIHFEIAAIGFDWPVFNIADSLLVCGAALMLWHAMRRHPTEAPSGE